MEKRDIIWFKKQKSFYLIYKTHFILKTSTGSKALIENLLSTEYQHFSLLMSFCHCSPLSLYYFNQRGYWPSLLYVVTTFPQLQKYFKIICGFLWWKKLSSSFISMIPHHFMFCSILNRPEESIGWFCSTSSNKLIYLRRGRMLSFCLQ